MSLFEDGYQKSLLQQKNGGITIGTLYHAADDKAFYYSSSNPKSGIGFNVPTTGKVPAGIFHKNEINYYRVGISLNVAGYSTTDARIVVRQYLNARHPFSTVKNFDDSWSWASAGFGYAKYRNNGNAPLPNTAQSGLSINLSDSIGGHSRSGVLDGLRR